MLTLSDLVKKNKFFAISIISESISITSITESLSKRRSNAFVNIPTPFPTKKKNFNEINYLILFKFLKMIKSRFY